MQPRPTRYNNQNGSSFFTVGDTPVTIKYALENSGYFRWKKKVIGLAITVGPHEDPEEFSTSHNVPHNLTVSDELGDVSNGLYEVMEQAMRSIYQREQQVALSSAVQDDQNAALGNLEMAVDQPDDPLELVDEGIANPDSIFNTLSTHVGSLTGLTNLRYGDSPHAQSPRDYGGNTPKVITSPTSSTAKTVTIARKGKVAILEGDNITTIKNGRTTIMNEEGIFVMDNRID